MGALKNFDMGGITVPSTGGEDEVVIAMPGGLCENGATYEGMQLGGGVAPSCPFNIVAASLSILSNDPLVKSYVGQMGACLDTIIPHNVGPGTFWMPPGLIIANDCSLDNQIHLHMAVGVNGAFGIKPTWGGTFFAIVQFSLWYTDQG
jgi:hypothetical protein